MATCKNTVCCFPTNTVINKLCSNALPPTAGVLAAAPNAGVLLPPKLKPLLADWLAVAPNLK
jgi:hypothetical protein